MACDGSNELYSRSLIMDISRGTQTGYDAPREQLREQYSACGRKKLRESRDRAFTYSGTGMRKHRGQDLQGLGL